MQIEVPVSEKNKQVAGYRTTPCAGSPARTPAGEIVDCFRSTWGKGCSVRWGIDRVGKKIRMKFVFHEKAPDEILYYN
jgi:hypothetical protein